MKVQKQRFCHLAKYCFLVSVIMSFMTISYASAQKNIGIIGFQNTSGCRGIEKIMQTALLVELSKNNNFRIVDRGNLDKILNEQSLSRTGVIEKDSAVQMGRVSGIHYLLTGSVLETAAALPGKVPMVGVCVFWELIDTTSGAVLSAATVTGTVNKILQQEKGNKSWRMPPAAYAKAAQNAAEKICESLEENLNMPMLSARVASIYGNSIYIDVGANKQVKPGQVFCVYQDGLPIHDPDSGEILGRQQRVICRIIINNVEKKLASGAFVDGDLSAVRIGSRVVRQ